jgi:hypothetical protein
MPFSAFANVLAVMVKDEKYSLPVSLTKKGKVKYLPSQQNA